MNRLVRVAMTLLLATGASLPLTGCGGPAADPTLAPATPAFNEKADIKAKLMEVANTGEGGSGLAGISEAIDKLGNEDLKKDMAALTAASDPAKIKEIAKRMADKL